MRRMLLLFALIVFFIGCGPTKSEFTVEQVPQVIAGNEIAAQARLRSIVTAEMSYQMESGGECASLDTLVEKGMTATNMKNTMLSQSRVRSARRTAWYMM